MATTPDIESALSDTRGARGIPGHEDDKYALSDKPCTREEEEIARIPTHVSRGSRNKKFAAGLVKTLTGPSNASVINPGPPPDGGSKAWTQACMGHLVIFNTW